MVVDGEVGPDAARLAGELERLGVATTTLVAGGGIGGLATLRRALRGADVVHAYGLRAALAVALARPGRTPFVVSLTEAPPVAGSLVTRAIHRAVFPAAAAVLVPTSPLAEAVTRLGARSVRVLPPPLPDPLVGQRTPEQVREELALPPEGPIVLAAGRLHPDTRLDVLVEAAARWRTRTPRPQVVLVGVGPAYRPLVAQATVARAPVTFAGDRVLLEASADVGVGEWAAGERAAGEMAAAERTATAAGRTAAVDRTATVSGRTATAGGRPTVGNERAEAEGPVAPFAVEGEQPDSDVAEEERASLSDLLAAASIAVVTDPWARPDFALAAARLGVPLVVAAGGTVAGLFPEGVTTVPPGDPEALDEAVAALLDDAAARADLAAAARRHVAGWPDAAAVAGELAELYAEVTGYHPANSARPGGAETNDTPG
jgi:glycosyltransferase involved in cell wall biosynthesis